MNKKINTVLAIAVIIIIAGIIGGFIWYFGKKQGYEINSAKPSNQNFVSDIDLSKIRLEIKVYIDELYDSEIASIEHTTYSIEESKKRLPDDPKAFSAGRYKVVFNRDDNDKKVMIFQTEEKVGHISEVIPGKTDIGGYVEIQKNPENDSAEGVTHTTKSVENQNTLNDYSDLKLNEFELDYLIRILYKKFEKPLTDGQANNLNDVKDYALAIKFSDKNGINEYHNSLINELKK